jgi:hypothetical protein
MPPFHPKSRMCLLSFAPVLGIAPVPFVGCGDARVVLGDVGKDCGAPSSCHLAIDSSADDSSANDDFGQPDDASLTVDAGDVPDSASGNDSTTPDSPILPETGVADADSGGNTLRGRPDGTRPFDTLASSWWIENPNPAVSGGPVVSTVVYLFSKPVACDKLTVARWDEINEPSDTQNLEINMAWSGTTEPMPPPSIPYHVVQFSGGSVPPQGTAGVLYQVTQPQPPGGPPTEQAAVGGMVTLTGLNPNVNTTGTIEVTFVDGGTLVGSFDAMFCQHGREP